MTIENNETRREEERKHDEEVEERHDERVIPPSRVSWGAIFAGTAMALAVAFMLSLAGTAIGLQSMDFRQGVSPLADFGVGAGLWLAFQIIIALFVGGWVAGRLAGKPKGIDGILNGAVVWAVTILLGLFGVTTLASNIIGGVTQTVSQSVDVEPGAVGGVLGQATQQAEETAQQVEPAQAAEAADTAASVMWWSLLGIALGLLAACLGGYVGSPKLEAWREERREKHRVIYAGRRRPPTPA